jgi:hypothetical protein
MMAPHLSSAIDTLSIRPGAMSAAAVDAAPQHHAVNLTVSDPKRMFLERVERGGIT